MQKLIVSIVLAAYIALIWVRPAAAFDDAPSASASLKSDLSAIDADYRVAALKKFLSANGSPLTGYAEDFIVYADKYGLDWRLVPSISGVESTFGKQIPAGSYNAYGWAGGEYRFASWQDSIGEVTQTLKTNYIEKGAVSIYQISRVYCPPSTTWAWKVQYFMGKIDPLPLDFTI